MPKLPGKWHPWEKRFLWRPTKINERWHWLRFAYVRFRLSSWAADTGNEMFEYEYTFNIFDVLKSS